MFQPPPNVTDYTTFLRNVAGISTQFLPNSSPNITTTLEVATELTNLALMVSGNIYCLAVYNLATDRLINYAQDVPGQCFFYDLRKSFNINSPTLGIVSSASDENTSASYLNPDFMKQLTLMDLGMLKTPFGRTYMEFAQAFGPNLFGLS